MGGRESKASDNTANVFNTVEVIDQKDEINFIAVLLLFMAIFRLVNAYKRSVQRRSADNQTLERIVSSIPQPH